MYTRTLRKIDLHKVRELDELSGNNVEQWLQDLMNPYDDASNCYGAFIEEELVGYFTIGDACGVLDLDYIGPDDELLSDVYVKKEYRHQGIATDMLEDILYFHNDVDVYLTLLHDDLIPFYENLGFKRVPGTDNVMLKYSFLHYNDKVNPVVAIMTLNKMLAKEDVDSIEFRDAISLAVRELEKNLQKEIIIRSWVPNLCPTCGEDLGGECYDGYYQNPYFEKCPKCGQKLKYDQKIQTIIVYNQDIRNKSMKGGEKDGQTWQRKSDADSNRITYRHRIRINRRNNPLLNPLAGELITLLHLPI